MKKFFHIAVVLLVILLTSCADNAAPNLCDVTVSVSSGMRGLAPDVSLETESYSITVKDKTSGTTAFSKTDISASDSSVSFQVQAGSYSVDVDAFNASGRKIGSGNTECTVIAGRNNSISVMVKELDGEGTFTLSINAPNGPVLKVKVLTPSEEEEETKTMTYADGAYSTAFSLQNGFHRFIIEDEDGKILKQDSLRILAGCSVAYTAEFTFTGDIGVAIKNEILPAPTVSITLSSSSVTNGEELGAECSHVGFPGSTISVTWYLDYIKLDATGKSLVQPIFDLEEGVHRLSAFVSDGTIVWSKEVEFIVAAKEEMINVPLYAALYVAGSDNTDFSYWSEATQTQYWIDLRQAAIDHRFRFEERMGIKPDAEKIAVILDNNQAVFHDYMSYVLLLAYQQAEFLRESLFDVLKENVGDTYHAIIAYPNVKELHAYRISVKPEELEYTLIICVENPFFLDGDELIMDYYTEQKTVGTNDFHMVVDSSWRAKETSMTYDGSSEQNTYQHDEEKKQITHTFVLDNRPAVVTKYLMNDAGKLVKTESSNGYRTIYGYRPDGTRSYTIEYSPSRDEPSIHFCDENGEHINQVRIPLAYAYYLHERTTPSLTFDDWTVEGQEEFNADLHKAVEEFTTQAYKEYLGRTLTPEEVASNYGSMGYADETAGTFLMMCNAPEPRTINKTLFGVLREMTGDKYFTEVEVTRENPSELFRLHFSGNINLDVENPFFLFGEDMTVVVSSNDPQLDVFYCYHSDGSLSGFSFKSRETGEYYEASSIVLDEDGRLLSCVFSDFMGAAMSWEYEYDDQGRLVASCTDGSRTTFTYDQDGNRIQN